MKKTLILIPLLFAFLVLPAFSGCHKTIESDIWDGTIAESFAKGDGSESKPYTIEKASQLAYLASEINEGKDYSGKHFALSCDLDLNHLEWTPIGNGTHSFNGVFDGNGHSIKNLKITSAMYFIGENSAGEHERAVAGLFGSCFNSIMKNLIIDGAEIRITNVNDRRVVVVGVLAGDVATDSHGEIFNVKVSDSAIIGDFRMDKTATDLDAGGLCGFIQGNETSSFILSQIQTDVQISIKNGRAIDNSIGGLSGFLLMENACEVKDCVSYLSVEVDTDDCYSTNNYFGAFGNLSARYDKVVLTNMFSKVTINKIHEYLFTYLPYTAHVIAGVTNCSCGNYENGGYRFENVFGYIEQIEEATGERVVATQLHDIPYPEIYTQINCQGCETLPTNHGFDESNWDLKDLSNPKLK